MEIPRGQSDFVLTDKNFNYFVDNFAACTAMSV